MFCSNKLTSWKEFGPELQTNHQPTGVFHGFPPCLTGFFPRAAPAKELLLRMLQPQEPDLFETIDLPGIPTPEGPMAGFSTVTPISLEAHAERI